MEQIVKRRLVLSFVCFLLSYCNVYALAYDIERDGGDLGASPAKML